MINIIFAFAIAITQFVANDNAQKQIDVEFKYLQYYDVRNDENEFENLRITYDICNLMNEHENARLKCREHAYAIAISIDA